MGVPVAQHHLEAPPELKMLVLHALPLSQEAVGRVVFASTSIRANNVPDWPRRPQVPRKAGIDLPDRVAHGGRTERPPT
jgi:hypothetical protein